MEVILEIESFDSITDFGIELSNSKGENYRIGYDGNKKHYYSDRTKAGKSDFNDSFADKVVIAPGIANSNINSLHLFIDVASVELFADNGSVVLTEIYFPNEDFTAVKLYAENGSIKIKSGKFYSIKSIWQ
jgi:sucrose-6-phosphate hydrolase SacC (GH32 family)